MSTGSVQMHKPYIDYGLMSCWQRSTKSQSVVVGQADEAPEGCDLERRAHWRGLYVIFLHPASIIESVSASYTRKIVTHPAHPAPADRCAPAPPPVTRMGGTGAHYLPPHLKVII